MRLAASGEVMHTDDTWVRILSCLKEDKEEKGRATNTSGIVVKVGGRKIALYLSGRRHAGENLAELLTKREEGLAPPIQMSDALAANTSVEKNVISAYCLAHARRKVFELREDYPAECAVVLDAVGKVYGYEAETAGMDGERRLTYHQEKSGPVMKELKAVDRGAVLRSQSGTELESGQGAAILAEPLERVDCVAPRAGHATR